MNGQVANLPRRWAFPEWRSVDFCAVSVWAARNASAVLSRLFRTLTLKTYFFWNKRNLLLPQKGAKMEQVKNLDDKRVCDKSKDSKVIVIRKKDCITRITANADRTLKVTHEYVK